MYGLAVAVSCEEQVEEALFGYVNRVHTSNTNSIQEQVHCSDG